MKRYFFFLWNVKCYFIFSWNVIRHTLSWIGRGLVASPIVHLWFDVQVQWLYFNQYFNITIFHDLNINLNIVHFALVLFYDNILLRSRGRLLCNSGIPTCRLWHVDPLTSKHTLMDNRARRPSVPLQRGGARAPRSNSANVASSYWLRPNHMTRVLSITARDPPLGHDCRREDERPPTCGEGTRRGGNCNYLGTMGSLMYTNQASDPETAGKRESPWFRKGGPVCKIAGKIGLKINLRLCRLPTWLNKSQDTESTREDPDVRALPKGSRAYGGGTGNKLAGLHSGHPEQRPKLMRACHLWLKVR